MPTRKISDREKLTIFARTASDAELDEAFEILSIERRVRASAKQPKKVADKKPAEKKATKDVPPGPPNPPRPDNDNPQG